MSNRRDFLKKGALLGLGSLGASLIANNRTESLEHLLQAIADGGKYTLPALPYAYDALEPFIDKQTMEIHHTKHHQAYVDKLNAELEKPENLKIIGSPVSFEAIFSKASKVQPSLRNNGGGHYNHLLFWQMLKPNPEGKENLPQGKLAEAILKDFKSLEEFRKEFSDRAAKHFGSGWCWLIDQNGKLKITTTANQDNPMMDVAAEKGKIILALDVWEHAYYLKYQNKRTEYISNWYNIINWNKAEELFNAK